MLVILVIMSVKRNTDIGSIPIKKHINKIDATFTSGFNNTSDVEW